MNPTKVALCWRNDTRNASLTTDSEASGLEAVNAGDERLSTRWRAEGTGIPRAAWIQADYGAGYAGPTEVVALLGSDVALAGTIRVRTDDAVGIGSPTYDSGVVSAYNTTHSDPAVWVPPAGRTIVHFPTAGVTERYMRLDLSGNGSVGGAVLWTGPVWLPTEYGVDTYLFEDELNSGGTTKRGVTLRWSALNLTDVNALRNITRYLGTDRRLLLVPQMDVAATHQSEAMLCKIKGDPRWQEVPSVNAYRTVSITFEEVFW